MLVMHTVLYWCILLRIKLLLLLIFWFISYSFILVNMMSWIALALFTHFVRSLDGLYGLWQTFRDTLPTSWVESCNQADWFASKLAKIYVNFNRSPLTIYEIHQATLWRSFMVNHDFCLVLISPVPGHADFSNFYQRQCLAFMVIAFWPVAVCKLPF